MKIQKIIVLYYIGGRTILGGHAGCSGLVDSKPESFDSGGDEDEEWWDLHYIHLDDEIKNQEYWVSNSVSTYSSLNVF